MVAVVGALVLLAVLVVVVGGVVDSCFGVVVLVCVCVVVLVLVLVVLVLVLVAGACFSFPHLCFDLCLLLPWVGHRRFRVGKPRSK